MEKEFLGSQKAFIVVVFSSQFGDRGICIDGEETLYPRKD